MAPKLSLSGGGCFKYNPSVEESKRFIQNIVLLSKITSAWFDVERRNCWLNLPKQFFESQLLDSYIYMVLTHLPVADELVPRSAGHVHEVPMRKVDPAEVHSNRDFYSGRVSTGTLCQPRSNQQSFVLAKALKLIGLLAGQHPIDRLGQAAG
jgi:hypothetical protein